MTSRKMLDKHQPLTQQTRPWWKEPYVWIVICGPLSAVVACIITAFYIMLGPDAVVPEYRYSEGLAIHSQVKSAQPPMQPAKIGRNHSATGGLKSEQP
jgi:uncharacterized protein